MSTQRALSHQSWISGRKKDMANYLEHIGDWRRKQPGGKLNWDFLHREDKTEQIKEDDAASETANAGAGGGGDDVDVGSASKKLSEEEQHDIDVQETVNRMIESSLDMHNTKKEDHTPEMLVFNAATDLHVAGIFNKKIMPDIPQWVEEEDPLFRMWEDVTEIVPIDERDETKISDTRITMTSDLLGFPMIDGMKKQFMMRIHTMTYIRACNRQEGFYSILCNIFPPYVAVYLQELVEMVQMRSTIFPIHDGETGAAKHIVITAVRLVFTAESGQLPVIFCMPFPSWAAILFSEAEDVAQTGVQWSGFASENERRVFTGGHAPPSIIESSRGLKALFTSSILHPRRDHMESLFYENEEEERPEEEDMSKTSLRNKLQSYTKTTVWQRRDEFWNEATTSEEKVQRMWRVMSVMLHTPNDITMRVPLVRPITALEAHVEEWFRFMERVTVTILQGAHTREMSYCVRDLPSCEQWSLPTKAHGTQLHWAYHALHDLETYSSHIVNKEEARNFRRSFQKETMMEENVPRLLLQFEREPSSIVDRFWETFGVDIIEDTGDDITGHYIWLQYWKCLFGQMPALSVQMTLVLHRRFEPYVEVKKEDETEEEEKSEKQKLAEFYRKNRPSVHILIPLNNKDRRIQFIPDTTEDEKPVCDFYPPMDIQPPNAATDDQWRTQEVACKGRVYRAMLDQMETNGSSVSLDEVTSDPKHQTELEFYRLLKTHFDSFTYSHIEHLYHLHLSMTNPLTRIFVVSVTDMESGACVPSTEENEEENPTEMARDQLIEHVRSRIPGMKLDA